MTTKITATYANGAFTPDVEVDLPEGVKARFIIGDRFEPSLPEGSPLAAAEREFAAAFANGGWDEARVREGSRLAWEAARGSVALAAKARGWAHRTSQDLWNAIYRLDGIDKKGGYQGRLRYFHGYCAADAFNRRSLAGDEDCDSAPMSERWEFADGLRMAHELIVRLRGDGEDDKA